MKIFFVPVCLLSSLLLNAHPGIGIVKDSKGFIYYTDLSRIWKLDPATETKTVVLKGVHTHELYMDLQNRLFGEHLWYNGEQLDTWGHYTWQLNGDGKLDTIIKPRDGFPEDYSLCRDSAGNMYRFKKFSFTTKIIRISPDGKVAVLAEAKFKNIRWMYATPGGVLYFVDLTDLYKIENGSLTKLATSLEERTSLLSYTDLQHNVYGIWSDKDENIYVAILGGKTVKKISKDGTVTDVLYTTGSWEPCSGIFDDSNNLWLMETNAANEVRIRKINKEKLTDAPPAFVNYFNKVKPFVLVIIFGLLLFFTGRFVFTRLRKPNSIHKAFPVHLL